MFIRSFFPLLFFVLTLAACGVSGTPVPATAPAQAAPTVIPATPLSPTVVPTFAPATAEPATALPLPSATQTATVAPTDKPLAYQFVWKQSTAQDPLRDAGVGAVDAQGNLYLLTAAEQLVKLDPDGNVLLTVGGPGSEPGQFTYWEDITTPLYPSPVAGADVAVGSDGTIYVAEGGNFRVQAFSPDGKFLRMWGKRGQGDGEFEVPWAIATDPQDNVYVGDFTGTIQKFDKTGKFLARFGKGIGAGKGQFVGAVTDVETDAQGNIYAADRKSGRIEKFDAAGNFLTQWDRCGNSLLDFRGLAVDAQGRVYVATRGGQRVCIFDTNGTLITMFGKEGLRDGEFLFGDASYDLVVDHGGALYVADSAGQRLQKFQPETVAPPTARTTPSARVIEPPLTPAPAPREIAFARSYLQVHYCTDDNTPLKMTILTPKVLTKPAPVLVHLKIRYEFIRPLVERGFIVADVDWREPPAHKLPVGVQDAKCAIRYLRANAEKYNLDPNRVGVFGCSRGGLLAAMVGVTDPGAGMEGDYGFEDESSRVQAVAMFDGIANFKTNYADAAGELNEIHGISSFEDPQVARLSPITYASPDDPPFFIMASDSDGWISQAQEMKAALDAQNVPVTYVLAEDTTHCKFAFSGPYTQEKMAEQVGDFFAKTLK